ncbi:unnamed protein product, partial [Oppiella nova]
MKYLLLLSCLTIGVSVHGLPALSTDTTAAN